MIRDNKFLKEVYPPKCSRLPRKLEKMLTSVIAPKTTGMQTVAINIQDV